MSLLVSGLVIIAGMYVGWALGANDGANSMGTAVGARVRTVREAVILVAIFGFLGAVLFGQNVIKTIGNGVVPLHDLPSDISLIIALAAMFAAGLWLQLATFFGIPVSTTHSAVGAVAGAGLAYAAVPIEWERLLDIVIAWLLTPIGAALLAYVLYRAFKSMIVPLLGNLLNDRVMAWLLTLSGSYMAFSWGSNDVANATGVMVGAGILQPLHAAVLGGIAIVIGVITWGPRVMRTIGSGITRLQPDSAFIAELAAGINVTLYSALGIPVSTTHSIVGAVIGVGLVYGIASIQASTARNIFLAWTATPLIGGTLAYVLFKLAAAVLL